ESRTAQCRHGRRSPAHLPINTSSGQPLHHRSSTPTRLAGADQPTRCRNQPIHFTTTVHTHETLMRAASENIRRSTSLKHSPLVDRCVAPGDAYKRINQRDRGARRHRATGELTHPAQRVTNRVLKTRPSTADRRSLNFFNDPVVWLQVVRPHPSTTNV